VKLAQICAVIVTPLVCARGVSRIPGSSGAGASRRRIRAKRRHEIEREMARERRERDRESHSSARQIEENDVR